MDIRVLGPLEAIRDGRQVDLGSPKQRLVLSVLVCQAGQVVSADSLIDALWADKPPASARANIQQHVLRLRKALGAQRLPSRGRQGYHLAIERGELDMFRFIDLVAEGRQALSAADWVSAARLFRDALSLWRGDPFADLSDEPALRPEIAQLQELRLDALEHRMEADLALGDHGHTVLELRQLVDRHPYRERFHEQLMLSLYRSGQRAAALEAYQHARKTLVGDLGLEPTDRLRRLETAMLKGEPIPVGWDAVPEAVAPVPPVPHYLPPDVAGFAGRDEHLRALDATAAAAAGDGRRIMVISGMAGVGKTALAVRWAHRAADRFPDGQLYVNLRGYAPEPPLTALSALTLFLRALGVPASNVPLDLDEAAGLYRTLLDGRAVLVILDNASTAEQVRPLLPGRGAAMVVVTSRDRLTGLVARDNARRLELGLLSQAESVALLRDFLSTTHRPALTKLAGVCGHLPLALRIAAAKLADGSHRDLSSYVATLSADRRLERLSVSGDSQASVQAAFELSYRVMAPAAQRLFRLLSLVPVNDVGEHAAAALLDTEPGRAQDLLGSLADAHLCEQRAGGRYGLHDLLRQYGIAEAGRDAGPSTVDAGVDEAVVDTVDDVLDRLCDFALGTVNAAAALLYGHTVRIPEADKAGRTTLAFADAAQARQWLDAELPNLVMLIHHAARHGPKPMAWLLADALRGYFWIRRPVAEWLATASDGLAAAGEVAGETTGEATGQASGEATGQASGETAGQASGETTGQAGRLHAVAAMRLSLGQAHRALGRIAVADEYLHASLEASRSAGWAQAQGSALSQLAVSHATRGLNQRAIELLGEALQINQRLGRPSSEAVIHTNLGALNYQLGDLRRSCVHAEEALRLFRESGTSTGEAVVLSNLGINHVFLGLPDRARQLLAEGQRLGEQTGDRIALVLSGFGFARLHLEVGELRAALRHAEIATELAHETGDAALVATCTAELALIRQSLGAGTPDAVAQCTRALAIAREASNTHCEVWTLICLARAGARAPERERHAREAISLARRCSYRILEGEALLTLAQLTASRDDAREAEKILTECGYRRGAERARELLG